MLFDITLIEKVYKDLPGKIMKARELTKKPLTLTEKILYSHYFHGEIETAFQRGKDYVDFAPDRVAMQDATAQMALLQFMNAGKKTTAVPTTVHCDHLIQAKVGAKRDLKVAIEQNKEVYDFFEQCIQ